MVDDNSGSDKNEKAVTEQSESINTKSEEMPSAEATNQSKSDGNNDDKEGPSKKKKLLAGGIVAGAVMTQPGLAVPLAIAKAKGADADDVIKVAGVAVAGAAIVVTGGAAGGAAAGGAAAGGAAVGGATVGGAAVGGATAGGATVGGAAAGGAAAGGATVGGAAAGGATVGGATVGGAGKTVAQKGGKEAFKKKAKEKGKDKAQEIKDKHDQKKAGNEEKDQPNGKKPQKSAVAEKAKSKTKKGAGNDLTKGINTAKGAGRIKRGESTVGQEAKQAAKKAVSATPTGKAVTTAWRHKKIIIPVVAGASVATIALFLLPLLIVVLLVGGIAGRTPELASSPNDVGAIRPVSETDYLALYQDRGETYRVPWPYLAAVGDFSTRHGVTSPYDDILRGDMNNSMYYVPPEPTDEETDGITLFGDNSAMLVDDKVSGFHPNKDLSVTSLGWTAADFNIAVNDLTTSPDAILIVANQHDYLGQTPIAEFETLINSALTKVNDTACLVWIGTPRDGWDYDGDISPGAYNDSVQYVIDAQDRDGWKFYNTGDDIENDISLTTGDAEAKGQDAISFLEFCVATQKAAEDAEGQVVRTSPNVFPAIDKGKEDKDLGYGPFLLKPVIVDQIIRMRNGQDVDFEDYDIDESQIVYSELSTIYRGYDLQNADQSVSLVAEWMSLRGKLITLNEYIEVLNPSGTIITNDASVNDNSEDSDSVSEDEALTERRVVVDTQGTIIDASYMTKIRDSGYNFDLIKEIDAYWSVALADIPIYYENAVTPPVTTFVKNLKYTLLADYDIDEADNFADILDDEFQSAGQIWSQVEPVGNVNLALSEIATTITANDENEGSIVFVEEDDTIIPDEDRDILILGDSHCLRIVDGFEPINKMIKTNVSPYCNGRNSLDKWSEWIDKEEEIPQFVVIAFGSAITANDTEYTSELTNVITKLKDKGAEFISVVTLLNNDSNEGSNPLEAKNNFIRKQADALGYTVIDWGDEGLPFAQALFEEIEDEDSDAEPHARYTDDGLQEFADFVADHVNDWYKDIANDKDLKESLLRTTYRDIGKSSTNKILLVLHDYDEDNVKIAKEIAALYQHMNVYSYDTPDKITNDWEDQTTAAIIAAFVFKQPAESTLTPLDTCAPELDSTITADQTYVTIVRAEGGAVEEWYEKIQKTLEASTTGKVMTSDACVGSIFDPRWIQYIADKLPEENRQNITEYRQSLILKQETTKTVQVINGAATPEQFVNNVIQLAAQYTDLGEELTYGAASVQGLVAAGVPQKIAEAYVKAASGIKTTIPSCDIPAEHLAGHGWVESHHGTLYGAVLQSDGTFDKPILGIILNGDGRGNAWTPVWDTDNGVLDGNTVYDRAVGFMQFIPETWKAYSMDGDGDGKKDPNNIWDLSLTAASFLCQKLPEGGSFSSDADSRSAAIKYNSDTEYVDLVMAERRRIEEITAPYKSIGGLTLGEIDPTAPVSTTTVTSSYGAKIVVNTAIAPQIGALLEDAAKDGVYLYSPGGGYRSTQRQIELRKENGCPDTYKSPASSCTTPTARPGSSMHEQGAAIDFLSMSKKYGGCEILGAEWHWMNENAERYGLYPLSSECWHWSTNGH